MANGILNRLFGATPMDEEQLARLLTTDPTTGTQVNLPGMPAQPGPSISDRLLGPREEDIVRVPASAREGPALSPEDVARIEQPVSTKPGRGLALISLLAGVLGGGLPAVLLGAGVGGAMINRQKLQKQEEIDRAVDFNAKMAAVEARENAQRAQNLPLDAYQKGFLAMKAAAHGENFTDPQVQLKWAAALDQDPSLRQEFDGWLASTRPIPTMQAVEDPDSGEVTYRWTNLRPGGKTTTNEPGEPGAAPAAPEKVKKPREPVPSNVLMDWSQALSAIDNLDVMMSLADQVPSGIRGWLTQKALESPKLRSSVATIEELSKKSGKVIPKEAYDYYAAWAQFRIAAQSIVKGIPSNYDVISLLNTIGSLDMGKEQRQSLLDYAKKLTLKLVEHQVALQQISGRRVSPDMIDYLKANGLDPDNAKLNAYKELPDCPSCITDVTGQSFKMPTKKDAPYVPKSAPTGAVPGKVKGKKTPQQEADEFLKDFGFTEPTR